MIIRQGRAFLAFKYTIFLLLIVNAFYFYFDAADSAEFVYQDGFAWSDIIVLYSSAIDSAAWILLLFIFELETFILEDEKLRGRVWAVLSTLSAACYAVILYSFYGYVSSLGVPAGFAAYSGADPCTLLAQGASFVISNEDYVPLTAAHCTTLAEGAFYNQSLNMFATPERFDVLNRLVWLDVVNAGVWIVIVAILQLEVTFDSSRWVGSKFYAAYKYFKIVLYGVLAVDAYYWLRLGDPWGAWDAFLWLVAFVFIELNVLTYQDEESREVRAATAG